MVFEIFFIYFHRNKQICTKKIVHNFLCAYSLDYLPKLFYKFRIHCASIKVRGIDRTEIIEDVPTTTEE